MFLLLFMIGFQRVLEQKKEPASDDDDKRQNGLRKESKHHRFYNKLYPATAVLPERTLLV